MRPPLACAALAAVLSCLSITGVAAYKQAFLGYYAYWGNFSVSEGDNVVTHNVKASLWPQEVGSVYKRSAEFDRGRLMLTTPPYQ